MVTLDQTAGLGLWYEDDLLRGASALGPAFGHIKVGKDDRPCECGQKGCLNAYVSARRALREEARALARARKSSRRAMPRRSFIAALAEAAQGCGDVQADGSCSSARARCSARRSRTSSICSIRKR